MVTVGDVRDVLDRAYPPRLAESWDRVGLVCGDPGWRVEKVAFALDCTQQVADEAVTRGAQMLVVHHPLLLRGVSSIAADTPKGRVLTTLIRAGVALFAAHTNADAARPGVNDKLAELVGIKPGRAIVPQAQAGSPALDHWGVHVPPGDRERVLAALLDAGAGQVGEYSHCAFTLSGTGQFQPDSGAHPTAGEVGKLFRAEEDRVLFVADRALRPTLLARLREVHPYEEPAFDITELAPTGDPETLPGVGRVGELPEPMRLRDFVQQVADNLPETCWGVRAAGEPDQWIKKVAVASGAGDSFLETVASLGVDCYVTSDLRHHPVDEYRRAGGPAVIDTAHWASEFPWTAQASEFVHAGCGVETDIISVRTDPWTMSAHPRRQ